MPQGLSCQAAGNNIGAGASQLFGKGKSQYSERGKLTPYVKTELTLEIRFFAERGNLLFAIAVNTFPEHPLLLSKGKIHRNLQVI
jgi:hypothetical protein